MFSFVYEKVIFAETPKIQAHKSCKKREMCKHHGKRYIFKYFQNFEKTISKN